MSNQTILPENHLTHLIHQTIYSLILISMPAILDILTLPDTMAAWPWPRTINPYYEEVKAASNAWFRTFKAFNPDSQRAFDKCDFCRLAALAYPTMAKEHLRTGCDLMNLFFVIDEYTDVEDATTCREMVDIVIDALHDPHKPRPQGEVLLGEVARQFWALAIKTASPSSQRHFLESFTAYLESVVAQAVDRDNDTVRTIESYMETRRENIGSRPSFVLLELSMNLPDNVFYDPAIVELSTCITDLLILDNDIASYNKEQATGDDRHNIVTLAMHHFGCNVTEAMEWVAQYHTEIEGNFMDGLKKIPTWGPEIDRQIIEYIDGLGNWLRANDCWSFESGRYFGSKGPEVQITRRVPLMPKVQRNDSLRREDVVIPMVDRITEFR
ncbi:uncharacterized protein FIBRA_06230 [Fibroporia radiculosa]|uniref:Terpene synthase n=1 Tax=Fibroporia radiculosa TaxID=599839 RepID=J4IB55_9APHY|nr:uncharacterized protein FIBRA_06230 [Fibroporia radiculosa]CCM04071.1 predicted protein [Fibroporia radiculosa]